MYVFDEIIFSMGTSISLFVDLHSIVGWYNKFEETFMASLFNHIFLNFVHSIDDYNRINVSRRTEPSKKHIRKGDASHILSFNPI